ncbi:DUF721 domain-containing protein [Sandarakinorhabdus sp. AAP62]|uniref:DUF721 domain-containing protein n=1 Tax=Sandarakinorhabdus sp. AAP62 TaxID=1248916 RepID=UPI0003019918|nr:DUF721 domain-containing protein [Sandarakinorhabdus sp. AAP62]
MPKTPREPPQPALPKSPKERVRGGRAKPIAELVGEVGGQAFKRFGFNHSALNDRWAEIVGATYARHCQPTRLKFPRGQKDGGTLTIAATGALAPMLRHVEPQIIERTNRILGYAAVARLSIDQGAATMAAATPPPPQPGPLPETARSSLRDIADPELRATLQSLAEALTISEGPPKIR